MSGVEVTEWEMVLFFYQWPITATAFRKCNFSCTENQDKSVWSSRDVAYPHSREEGLCSTGEETSLLILIYLTIICVLSRRQLNVSCCLQIRPFAPPAERADPNCSGPGQELLWLSLFACTIQAACVWRRMFLPSQRSAGQSRARVLGVPVATKEYCVPILFIRFLCKHQQGRRAYRDGGRASEGTWIEFARCDSGASFKR